MLDIHLTEIEVDAISEIFNIGMGQAAAALSQLVHEEVILSVPSIELLAFNELLARFPNEWGIEVCGVKESFSGPFQGDAILFFNEPSSLELVRALLADDVPEDQLTEMEQEAMSEVGNIILNACLSSIANLFAREIATGLPRFVRGAVSDLLGGENAHDALLFLRMQFLLEFKGHQGYVAFLMDIASVHGFKACLKPLLQ
jgi:chemotaxis protein CheC